MAKILTSVFRHPTSDLRFPKRVIVTVMVLITASATLLPLPALAFSLVPCGGTGQDPCQFKHLVFLIIRVINYLISVAAVVAMYYILLNGFNLMTSLGNPEKIKKGKVGIANAVVGFGIVVLAFVFVNLLANGIFGKGPTAAQRSWWDPKCIYGIGERGDCPLGIIKEK